MLIDYQKIDLFGKQLIQKITLTTPFEFDFPVENRACFIYVLEGDIQYLSATNEMEVPTNYSLLLNCLQSGIRLQSTQTNKKGEAVIVTFHPDILKKIYEKELPKILKPTQQITNQSAGKITNDFLIKKYIEGLLFYFENPTLVNEEILILKLKEIILLLSQTQDAENIQVILSQLFSPVTYTFKQIVEAHLFSRITIEQLAEKTNMSASSFKREFKKLYNDSPANYIKNKRLEKAAELLLVSGERITHIAFDCGFNDLAGFTKSFHNKYDCTPTDYRKHNSID